MDRPSRSGAACVAGGQEEPHQFNQRNKTTAPRSHPTPSTIATKFGYRSGAQTQENADSLYTRRFGRKKTLKVFRKEVAEPTVRRFHDIQHSLSRPLAAYLVANNLCYTALAMSMQVLGEIEADARPWIVILCDSNIADRVARFFRLKWVQQILRPEDGHFPYFDFCVKGVPVEPRGGSGGTPVYNCDPATKYKYAPHAPHGMRICFISDDRLGRVTNDEPYVTLGVIILVKWSDEETEIYGLTVGHLLQPWTTPLPPDTKMNLDNNLFLAMNDEGSDYRSDSEVEVGLDVNIDLSFDDAGSSRLNPTLDVAQIPLIKLGEASNLGLPECNEPNLDHYLINFESEYNESLEDFGWSILLSENPKSGLGREVLLLSWTGSARIGTLSSCLSALLLAPGTQFVETYRVKMADGLGIFKGDCGSWVVDRSTQELYGHIVGSDIFGEGHVMPMIRIFEDIKRRMKAESVSVASPLDIGLGRKLTLPTDLESPNPTSYGYSVSDRNKSGRMAREISPQASAGAQEYPSSSKWQSKR